MSKQVRLLYNKDDPDCKIIIDVLDSGKLCIYDQDGIGGLAINKFEPNQESFDVISKIAETLSNWVKEEQTKIQGQDNK